MMTKLYLKERILNSIKDRNFEYTRVLKLCAESEQEYHDFRKLRNNFKHNKINNFRENSEKKEK